MNLFPTLDWVVVFELSFAEASPDFANNWLKPDHPETTLNQIIGINFGIQVRMDYRSWRRFAETPEFPKQHLREIG